MLRHAVSVAGVLLLAGCGGVGSMSLGSLNPFSWGSGSDPAAVQQERIAAARSTLASIDDGRILLPEVNAVALDRGPSGVIVRAEGPIPALGYHAVGLRPVGGGRPDESGTVRFQLVAFPPDAAAATGSAFARRVATATFLANSRLRGVDAVTVIAAGGERTIRLR